MENNFLEIAIAVARSAGEKQRMAFGGALTVDEALDHDIKLRLDVECQELITASLLKKYPAHTVFGEEGGSDYGASEYQWIVDPIDGTVNFFYNFPHFCTAIALQKNKETIIGVTYDPVRDEMFSVVKGDRPRLNGQPVATSQRSSIGESMISTGFTKEKEHVDQSIDRIRYIAQNARKIRMNGCAALDMAYIACGRLDAYVELGVRLWDVAGGKLMIEEGGGKVDLTPKEGTPLSYKMVASNGKIGLSRWDDWDALIRV